MSVSEPSWCAGVGGLQVRGVRCEGGRGKNDLAFGEEPERRTGAALGAFWASFGVASCEMGDTKDFPFSGPVALVRGGWKAGRLEGWFGQCGLGVAAQSVSIPLPLPQLSVSVTGYGDVL